MSRTLPLRDLLPDVAGVPDDTVITGLVQDSRAIRPGDAFVAIGGFGTHGLHFVDTARAAGASAILFEPPVPAEIPVTAKMRLGFEGKEGALDCSRALAEGGASQIVVHARTKVEGYKPPAHWEWVARVQEVVPVPVYANGDIWSLEDWRRCREVSGAEDIMLGRGLVSRPDLARQIAAAKAGQQIAPMSWEEFRPVLLDFWQQARGKIAPRYAPGRLKQWLALLTRNYPEAVALFAELRRENDCARIDAMLGVDTRELRAVALA